MISNRLNFSMETDKPVERHIFHLSSEQSVNLSLGMVQNSKDIVDKILKETGLADFIHFVFACGDGIFETLLPKEGYDLKTGFSNSSRNSVEQNNKLDIPVYHTLKFSVTKI